MRPVIDEDKIQDLLQSNQGLSALLGPVLSQVKGAEMAEHLQAAPHVQTDRRHGYRSGSYARQLTTCVGTLDLEVPRDREGSFQTSLFDRYPRSEKALVHALMQMVWRSYIANAGCLPLSRQEDHDRTLRPRVPIDGLAPLQEAGRDGGRSQDRAGILEDGFDDATAVLALPPKYQRRLRTTSIVKHLIEEIRLRELGLRIFPTMDVARGLIGTRCAEQHEEGSTGRHYLTMDAFFAWENA